MKNVWGWESSKDRLKRYSCISAKRKMEALEDMRQFILKVRSSGHNAVPKATQS